MAKTPQLPSGGKSERGGIHDNKHRFQRSSGLFITPEPLSSTPNSAASFDISNHATSREEHEEHETNSEEDDEDDEDSEDDEEFHDQLKEPLPAFRAYHPRMDALKQQASDMVTKLADQLAPYIQVSADIENMASKAKEAAAFYPARKPIIMLLGDTGTGKSSTTNSLVDDLGASKAVAGGESVTCVPTLITCSSSAQDKQRRSTYTAEIRFLDRETCQTFLQGQLDNYIRWEFDQDSSWDDEERKDAEALRNTALKIFRTLFCNHFEFESPGSIRDYLQQHRTTAGITAIGTLMVWYDAIFYGYEQVKHHPIRRFAAATSQALNVLIDPYIFEHADYDEPSLWPLVKHVRKGLPDSRILEHVELFDLPGTSDLDRVRETIALNYIKDCDALWVITSINRLVSDPALDSVLATYGERFNNNVTVVATNSDANVNDALAKDMQAKNCSVGEYWNHSIEIAKLREQIRNCRSKKRQRSLDGSKSVKQFRDREELQERLQILANEQFEGLVSVRNSCVKRRLEQDKKRYFPGKVPPFVFCISNTHYASCKGEPSEDSRQMNVEATGIPNLRAHALKTAAPAEFRAADAHITRITTLIKGAALWVDKTINDPYKTLLRYVKAPKHQLDSTFQSHITSSQRCFDSLVIQQLRSERERFITAALRVIAELNGWRWQTFRAFVNKDGKHMTEKKPYQSWNERFMEDQTAGTLDRCWENAMERYRKSLNELVEKTVTLLIDLPEKLDKAIESAPVPVAHFETLLRGHISRIKATHVTRSEIMEKTFRNIKLNACKDVPEGYFTEAMRPIYDEAKACRGTGSVANMREKIHKALSLPGSKSPFAAVVAGIHEAVDDAVLETSNDLQSDVRSILCEIEQQFERILKNDQHNQDEIKVRARLRPFLKKAVEEANTIEQELAAIKDDATFTD